jgi:hypothetical protein
VRRSAFSGVPRRLSVPAHELTDDEGRSLWFSGYVQTYLERDLQALRAVENLADFRRLMRAACVRLGSLLNQKNFAAMSVFLSRRCIGL